MGQSHRKLNYCWPTIHICVHDIDRMFGWHKVTRHSIRVMLADDGGLDLVFVCQMIFGRVYAVGPPRVRLNLLIRMGINMRGKALCYVEHILSA